MLRNCDLNGIFPYINFFSQFFTRKNFFFQIKNLDFITVWLIRRPVFLFASLALKTKWMKYMKTRYNALHSVAMMLGLLLVGGVTGAWADLKKSESSNDVCSPVIHFKLPDGWTSAYLMIGGNAEPFPNPRLADNGWTVIDLGSTKTNDDAYFFINGVRKNDCNDGVCVTRNGINVKPNNARVEGFKCSDIGSNGEIWIQEHPDIKKEGQVYITTSKPDIKDFYVFLPDNTTWKSSTPMIKEDGVDHEMYVDNDHCGWYYRRYILDGKIDKALPSSVIIHRDDDKELNGAIGMGGEKALNEDQAAEPIVLADLFDLFQQDPSYHGAVYFLADQIQADALGGDTYGWSATQPSGAVGNCSYNLAAVIYDTDADLHPLFSCYQENADEGRDGCQTRSESQKAIYSCIGVRQGLVQSTLAIENGKKKMKLTADGEKCFLSQATFDQMFNMTKGVNEMSCYDMTFTRAKDGKWEFDSDYFTSPGLKTPVQGGFYPVEATTNADILAADSTQTPAPKARTKRWAQGPVFYGPLLRANDPTEQLPKIDVYCKGPGWPEKKGVTVDCEGLFADGDGTTSRINSDLKIGTVGQDACVFGWSCNDKGSAPEGWPFYSNGSESKGTETGRWESTEDSKSVNGGRNQHFCFESHASFRYKPGLKFNFRGDDDIWVFIDRKLAVDLGGTHLAAPGYVDVDYFMKKNGYGLDSIGGRSFDIDIYFCDRRTTMSNVRIKTNMFIEQTTGIMAEGKQDTQDYILHGNNHFKICYKKSGNGSCAAALGGSAGEELTCDDKIKEKITFVFTQDKTGQDPTKVKITEADFEADPVQARGGIDVTKPYAPVINDSLLAASLGSGKFYLIVKIGGDMKAIEVNLKGKLGVANRDAIPIDVDGNKGFLHQFKSQAMASSPNEDGTPDIKQMIPLYIASITDPCNANGCTDPLEMMASANQSYTLTVSNPKVVLYKVQNGTPVPLNPSEGTTIGESGLDTIYATIPFDDMESAVETATIGVRGGSNKADIKFFVPRLVFVETDSTYKLVSGDPEPPKETRLRGSAYPFYIVALNGDDSPCGELCNFPITKGSKTSPGLNVISGTNVENGRATVWVQSSLVYEKCNAPSCRGAATLHITGPNPALMQATYNNLQFSEPPVPTPLFADIFDTHGEKMASDINVPTPYYVPEQEYLDGIGDSLVIYYHRYFHKDSLPDSVFVYWDDLKGSKDSLVKFDAADISKGVTCGAKAGLADTLCLGRISLWGKKLSSDVKTSGTGKLKSWATFTSRGSSVTKDYPSIIYDRIAPIIVSARAITDTANGMNAQLKVEFSEKIAKVSSTQGDAVFSFYINAGKDHHFENSISLANGVSLPEKLDVMHTFIYSQKTAFPQAGDYIHFRGVNGIGVVMDQSDYKSVDSLGADTLRMADGVNWNIAPPYDSDPNARVPSPWVLITGDVSAYAVRLVPTGYDAIPPTVATANLPSVEVLTFDAYKDEGDFKKALINKDITVDTALAKYGYVPHGWFVKSDMSALIVADTTTQKKIAQEGYEKVFFNFEIQLFTNLGSHALTYKRRIYCDDNKNYNEYGRHYFGGSNCVDKPKNFFILWNMKGDSDRLVGTGAFVSKLKSYVQLGSIGKKNKNDKTEMWGVRHNTSVIGSFNVEKSN